MYKPSFNFHFLFTLLLNLIFFYPLNSLATTTLSPEEILIKANEARDIMETGVEWKINILVRNGQGEQSISAIGKVRGSFSVTIVETPENLKGTRIYIAKDKLWFWKPGQNLPIPITKQQKLMGPAAYGDILSTDYAKNYSAELIGEEIIDNRLSWIFSLKAFRNDVAYSAIKYWIDQQDYLGIKAEFFTASGKIVKSAKMKYDNHVVQNGNIIPFISEITITEEQLKFEEVILTFSDPILKEIPDEVFNLNFTP